uniref:Uncharacterized protein n=1 Tax=Rhizophora mucronata TaxID=61149 RepID=A0A2P2NCC8_RHIMU
MGSNTRMNKMGHYRISEFLFKWENKADPANEKQHTQLKT